MISKEEKTKIMKEFARSENDVGSAEVQIAVLTARINDLSSHMKEHKHDYSSNRGLLAMVSNRRRLLAYLKKTEFARYADLIKKLGLRR